VDSTEIGKMPNLAQILPELTTKSHSVGESTIRAGPPTLPRLWRSSPPATSC